MNVSIALLLLAGLQEAPAAPADEVAVLLTRRVDLPRLTAGEIVQAVTAAVEAEKLAVLPAARVKAERLPEPDTCAGKKDCVLGQARKLGATVVVGVQVGSVAGSTAPVAVHLDALRVSDGVVLADLDASVQRDKLKAIAGLADFAKRLREAMRPPVAVATPEPKPATATSTTTTTTDTKVVLAVVPPPPPIETGVPPEALGTGKEASAPSHTAGYAMVGVAGVTAAAAVACLVSGLVLRKDLNGIDDGGVKKINLTRTEAEARVRTVNILMTTSVITAIVAAGTGATAAIVW